MHLTAQISQYACIFKKGKLIGCLSLAVLQSQKTGNNYNKTWHLS